MTCARRQGCAIAGAGGLGDEGDVIDTPSIWSALTRFSTFDAAVDAIIENAKDRTGPTLVVTANIQHMAVAERDPNFASLLRNVDIVVPDGWPIVAGLRALGKRRATRITGADLFPAVVERAEREDLSIGFIGGGPGVADLARRRAESLHPRVRVTIAASPEFGPAPAADDARDLVAIVGGAGPDLLFLCVGTPKSEQLAWLARDHLSSGAVMCFGAAIDFYAGTRQRAPAAWRRLNAEWLYRLIHEPARLFPRYAKSLPFFIASFAVEVWHRRRTGQS